jgi:hypothetical protein
MTGGMAPLVKAKPPTRETLAAILSRLQTSDEAKQKLLERFERMFLVNESYENDRYEVLVSRDDPPLNMIHLAITPKDDKPVHSWTDMQAIKNELCGPESEGCELYPAESPATRYCEHLSRLGVYESQRAVPVRDKGPSSVTDRRT